MFGLQFLYKQNRQYGGFYCKVHVFKRYYFTPTHNKGFLLAIQVVFFLTLIQCMKLYLVLVNQNMFSISRVLGWVIMSNCLCDLNTTADSLKPQPIKRCLNKSPKEWWVLLRCRVKCYLFSWTESPSCPAAEPLSPPCRTSFELPHLRLLWPASPQLPSATPSSWILTPSRLWRPSPQRSPPAWAAWALISQSRVRAALKTSHELSRGSACFQTRGWTLGKLVGGRISLGGRTARKAGKRMKYKNTAD